LEDYLDITNSLRKVRREKGVSLRELAELIDTTESSMSRKERGISQFTIVEALIVADYLEEDVRDLFKIEERNKLTGRHKKKAQV